MQNLTDNIHRNFIHINFLNQHLIHYTKFSQMKSSEYIFSISFCDAIYYSAEDVAKIISKATFDYQLCNMPEYRNIAIHLGIVENPEGESDFLYKIQNGDSTKEPWLAYHNTVKVIYQEEELRDQRHYSIDRMIKSVLNHEIEFWNSDATKVLDLSNIDLGLKPKAKLPEPISIESVLKNREEHTASILDGSFVKAYKEKPKHLSIYSPLHRTARYQRQYGDVDYWISRSTIYKSDLIKFCNLQKIEATFEEEDQKINIKPRTPGKIPRTGVGKIATDIAWDIELKTGKAASAEEVIETLQTYISENKFSNTLLQTIPGGVIWVKKNTEKKVYNLIMCRQALYNWNISRH